MVLTLTGTKFLFATSEPSACDPPENNITYLELITCRLIWKLCYPAFPYSRPKKVKAPIVCMAKVRLVMATKKCELFRSGPTRHYLFSKVSSSQKTGVTRTLFMMMYRFYGEGTLFCDGDWLVWDKSTPICDWFTFLWPYATRLNANFTHAT
jgi:hypothetical protein